MRHRSLYDKLLGVQQMMEGKIDIDQPSWSVETQLTATNRDAALNSIGPHTALLDGRETPVASASPEPYLSVQNTMQSEFLFLLVTRTHRFPKALLSQTPTNIFPFPVFLWQARHRPLQARTLLANLNWTFW